MTDVGLAIIGAGSWGKNLVRNFAALDGVTLRWICDKDPAIRNQMSVIYRHVQCVEDIQQALSDSEVRAVVVATDVPSHFAVAREVLIAGKDVLVEKPLALTSRDAKELCELADRNERILMVGHLLLYHPAVERLRSMVQQGELGDVLYAYSQRLNLGVVRRDENAWWSLAPHDIAVANHVLGMSPLAVTASGGVFLQPEQRIEDVVFATLYYPGGKVFHIHVSWLDPHKTRRLTVVGAKKMAVFDDTSSDQKLMLFDKGVEPPKSISYAEGVRVRTGDIQIPALRMEEPLRKECQAFIEAVRTRASPAADGLSALSVVKVLEAGSRSLEQHGKRIAVD